MATNYNAEPSDFTFGNPVFDEYFGNTWYRVWAEDVTGENGYFVDTSMYNDFADGWIEADHLALLLTDYEQFMDKHLRVESYRDICARGKNDE
jgi:hypothetical protein